MNAYAPPILAVLAATLLSVSSAIAATTTVFDVPGATGTIGSSINDSGVVTGSFVDAEGQHGFVRASDGTITTFDAPNAISTQPVGINSGGTVLGIAQPSTSWPLTCGSYTSFGFIRDPAGNISNFCVQGGSGATETVSVGITRSGAVVGYENESYYEGSLYYDGFLRQPNGKIANIFAPGAKSTWAWSLNEGQIAGYFADTQNRYHGFVRPANGGYITFDPTGSTATKAMFINATGFVTGYYIDSSNVQHGFLRQSGGLIVTFDPTGSYGTSPTGINNNGVIVGSFVTSTPGASSGFLRYSSGSIQTVQVSGSSSTVANSININNSVTGYYKDAAGTHGFVWMP